MVIFLSYFYDYNKNKSKFPCIAGSLVSLLKSYKTWNGNKYPFSDRYSFFGQNMQKELQFIVNVYSNWNILLWCKGQITLVENKKSSSFLGFFDNIRTVLFLAWITSCYPGLNPLYLSQDLGNCKGLKTKSKESTPLPCQG